jgi:hypothetical protein
MKCNLCGKDLIKKSGDHEFLSKIAGTLIIPNIEYLECPERHIRLLSPDAHKKIIDYVSAKEGELIAQQPVNKFVSANQAAAILKMSKQAFSKNSRIARGFILGTEIDKRMYYLKESVEEFMQSKDGRLNLAAKLQEPTVAGKKWSAISTHYPSMSSDIRESGNILRFRKRSFYPEKLITAEANNYVGRRKQN